MTQTPNDRRRFQRIATDKTVEVTVGNRCYRCAVLDISLRGLLFVCDDKALPAQGEPAHVCILLDGEDRRIEVEGTVAHVQDRRVGVHCRDMDIESAGRLRRLVELNLEDGARLERELSELIADQG